MTRTRQYHKGPAKAIPRRRNAQECLDRDQRQAQRAAEALHHALEALGLPATVVAESAGRLRSQQKLLSNIVGVMFPALFGCRASSEPCRVRGPDKHWPLRLPGALPKRSRLRRRRFGLEVRAPLWRHVETKSSAPWD